MAKKDWMVKVSELDDLQREIFYADLDKSGIVSGCAGSGKSVLALLKAQRIQQEKGTDCQVIVYTKALNHFMEKGKKELGLNVQFYYHEEWKWKIVMKYYGRKGFLPVYDRDQFRNKIANKPSAQYVIVDEIQDFSTSEIKEFLDATQSNFYFFGDTAQSLYGSLKGGNTLPVSQIKPLLLQGDPKVKEWELWKNHRLPIPVALLSQEIGVGLKAFDPRIYTSKETSIPRVVEYDSLESQLQAVCRIIKNGNLDDVAILLPDTFLVKDAYQKLRYMDTDIHFEVRYNELDEESGKPCGEDTLNFDTNNPKIMTYHSAKGLQFETVILPYLDCFNDDQNGERRISLYVAVTRTYRNLYMLYTKGAMPNLLSIIANKGLWKSVEIDEVEDK